MDTKVWIILPIAAIFLVFFSIDNAYASHNSILIVSAENPTFNNHFTGSMVIEVVVNDSDIKDIDDDWFICIPW